MTSDTEEGTGQPVPSSRARTSAPTVEARFNTDFSDLCRCMHRQVRRSGAAEKSSFSLAAQTVGQVGTTTPAIVWRPHDGEETFGLLQHPGEQRREARAQADSVSGRPDTGRMSSDGESLSPPGEVSTARPATMFVHPLFHWGARRAPASNLPVPFFMSPSPPRRAGAFPPASRLSVAGGVNPGAGILGATSGVDTFGWDCRGEEVALNRWK
jgi:hypothetical protein